MSVEGFDEIFNTVCIAKKLYDIGKYELVKDSFYDEVSYDSYYENMFYLIENLFQQHYCRYSDSRCMELHVMSDPIIEEFYKLAGEYGKRNHIPDVNNYYIKEAEKQVQIELDFSYCLGWRLMGHTNPKRKHHSRLAVFIYQEDYVDIGCLAYALIEIYEWFSDACINLKRLLNIAREEVKAA